jgi:hypothetical protein
LYRFLQVNLQKISMVSFDFERDSDPVNDFDIFLQDLVFCKVINFVSFNLKRDADPVNKIDIFKVGLFFKKLIILFNFKFSWDFLLFCEILRNRLLLYSITVDSIQYSLPNMFCLVKKKWKFRFVLETCKLQYMWLMRMDCILVLHQS